MLIAIPQLNYKVGDIQENSNKIISAIKRAKAEKAELVIFPELAICGALPQDLLEREEFINNCRSAIEQIATYCTHLAVIIGAPNLDSENGIMYNSAYFIQDGEVVDGVHKNILSDYDIFSESRYFIAGEDNSPIRYLNQNIRIIFDEYEAEFIEKTDSFVVYLGMNPFTTESKQNKQQVLSSLAQKYGKNIIAVNHVGGNTAVLFDGNSMVYNYKGKMITCMQEFEEDFCVTDSNQLGNIPSFPTAPKDKIALIHKALVTGIKDYFNKNGFNNAILGLSGGIDSAVVAALAAEALGAEHIMGLLMPSEFSSEHSIQDAEALAQNIGMPHKLIQIKDIYEQYLNTLQPLFKGQTFNVAEENIQARIRGMLVMAMSNKFGYIALNTSNKSEAAVGYGTLYGDLCGSLGIIGDIYKTEIYDLARHINRKQEIIPENTITKEPSAELRPGQKDQDSLPGYDQLDAILKLYLEEDLSTTNIIAQGYPKDTVEKIIKMVKHNEYKRAQCPPILKVSKKSFGYGRKYPY
ncbi:MAG: NAD+ synthase [Odoribacter sp.]